MKLFESTARLACAALLLCGLPPSAYALPGGSVVRVLTLRDLGLEQQVTLNDRNFEQHFYFPVAEGVPLQDARLEIHGSYLHPFAQAAAVSVLVNGMPVFAQRLPGGEGTGRAGEQGTALDISLPLSRLQVRDGFLNIGVVLSSQVDATRCIDERGRGNELTIDPAATRLVYGFAADAVRDVRTLLTTLPRHPLILLPGRQLDANHYATALRLSQALSKTGLQPRFMAIPQAGDTVETAGLAEAARTPGLRLPPGMAQAVAGGQPYRIAHAADSGAWLVLRMLAADGLAQIVLDPEQTRKALQAVLPQADAAVSGELRRRLQLDQAGGWLAGPLQPQSNVRVALLAGQPVLAVEGSGMEQAAGLIATVWRQLAGSPELALARALPLAEGERAVKHVHFTADLPVLNVATTAEWMVPIALDGLPQGEWPDALELNLMAAPSGDGLSPVVSVLMNDNLLTAASLRTDGEITRLRVHIPQYALRADNRLRVEVRRRVSGGHCSGAAQGFPVQLLPSSYLSLRALRDVQQFYMLATAFDREGEIVVPSRYLQQSTDTLPVVSAVLRGLSIDEHDFKLVVDAKPGFKPDHAFVAFETTPASDTAQVTAASGRLLVRNRRNHKVFDSTGLGKLAVLQLLQSGGQYGVSITTVNGALPALRNPLELSAGNLAIADASGTRLAFNLDDPQNDWQLDEQNRGVRTFMQRYRSWFILLGVLLLPVLAVFGLRWYFRSRQQIKG
jgi:hypothetical protein